MSLTQDPVCWAYRGGDKPRTRTGGANSFVGILTPGPTPNKVFKHDNVVLSPTVSALRVLSILSLNTYMAAKSYFIIIVKRVSKYIKIRFVPVFS